MNLILAFRGFLAYNIPAAVRRVILKFKRKTRCNTQSYVRFRNYLLFNNFRWFYMLISHVSVAFNSICVTKYRRHFQGIPCVHFRKTYFDAKRMEFVNDGRYHVYNSLVENFRFQFKPAGWVKYDCSSTEYSHYSIIIYKNSYFTSKVCKESIRRILRRGARFMTVDLVWVMR